MPTQRPLGPPCSVQILAVMPTMPTVRLPGSTARRARTTSSGCVATVESVPAAAPAAKLHAHALAAKKGAASWSRRFASRYAA